MTTTMTDQEYRDLDPVAESAPGHIGSAELAAAYPEVWKAHLSRIRRRRDGCDGDKCPGVEHFVGKPEFIPALGAEQVADEHAGPALESPLRCELRESGCGLAYGGMFTPERHRRTGLALDQRLFYGCSRACANDAMIVLVESVLARSVSPQATKLAEVRVVEAESRLAFARDDYDSNTRRQGKVLLEAETALFVAFIRKAALQKRVEYLKLWRKQHAIYFTVKEKPKPKEEEAAKK